MTHRNNDSNTNIYTIKNSIIYKYYCTYALSVDQYSIINNLCSIISNSIFLEFLQIALCALRLTDLYICIIIYIIIIIIIVLVVIIIIIAYDSISL